MFGNIVLIMALLPIWRDPSWEGGVNALQAVKNLATLPQKEHIEAGEAIEQAKQAYQKYVI